MRAHGVSVLFLAALVVASCSQSSSNSPTPLASAGDVLSVVSGQGGGKSPLAAVMQFGQANVGSPFPPGSGHDQSAHAVDNIVPRTVVIKVNGTVTFNLPASVHQINIYKPGTKPEDVDVSEDNRTTLAAHAGCGAPLPADLVNAPIVIDDGGDNFEAAIPVPCLQPTSMTYTFTQPGRYLVICAFLPHFEVGMYAWVEVKDA
jgi:plastocyanin